MTFLDLIDLAPLAWRRARAQFRLGPPTLGAACVLRDEHGRILLVRSTVNRRWGVPGGYGEPGESYLETARRETREEVGVDLDGLTFVTEVVARAANHRSGVFVRDLTAAEVSATHPASWEVSDIQWVAPEAINIRLTQATQLILRAVSSVGR